MTVGATSYSYDANGNLTSKTDTSGTWQYSWDYENRLTQVTRPDGQIVTYKYDALGRRIERSKGGQWTRFTYDGADVVRDAGSDGSTVEYTNGLSVDEKLTQRTNGGALYFVADHLGSTRAITDSAGNVVETQQYDAFGDGAGSSLTRYGYTGRERDVDTGLYYYRARWYDAQAGRFLSEDPIGLAGGINWYAYVGNNPANLTDPSGLCAQDTERRDLPEDIRKIYTDPKNGRRLTKCINEVFGVDANRLEYQQLRNAPIILNYRTGAELGQYTAPDGTKFELGTSRGQTRPQRHYPGSRGIISIASDVLTQETARPMSSTEILQRVYIHELGNLLSFFLTEGKTANGWGDPNGIVSPFNTPNRRSRDYDTGAKLEKCFFNDQ